MSAVEESLEVEVVEQGPRRLAGACGGGEMSGPVEVAPSSGLADDYAPGEDVRLASYAALVAAYVATVAGVSAAVARTGRRLPKVGLADVALLGMATHKLSRRIAKASVTSPLRAPFTRLEGPAGAGELNEQARGRGLRKAVGELLTCPFCLSQWVATGFVFGLAVAPRATRLAAAGLAALTVSDFLQLAYSRAQSR